MDRNILQVVVGAAFQKSLSARRAWIEIIKKSRGATGAEVALRKESVDRNVLSGIKKRYYEVALRKESVDRNI